MADAVTNGDAQNFNRDVIQASMTVPVIVDFWAPWCGPCKQLGPVLERLVRAAAGRLKLVKINADEQPELAAQLRVQSIPTVYAFVGGRPVDGFVGAQSESQVRAFVDRLAAQAGAPNTDAEERANELLQSGEPRGAAELFTRLLGDDPGNPRAIAGLIRARVALGDVAAARKIIRELPPELAKHTAVTSAEAAVELAEAARDAPQSIDALRAKVDADPGQHAIRLDLARAYWAKGQAEAAIAELLAIIRADREWNDEAARKQLVKIFDALGVSHPLAVQSRRQLSSILFS